jgi:hypothetical protein
MNVVRLLATAYAVLVGLVAAWAWYTDLTLWNSAREHLLPDFVLMYVTAPASYSVNFIPLSTIIAHPLTPLVWLTACGALQALALFLIAWLARKHVTMGL